MKKPQSLTPLLMFCLLIGACATAPHDSSESAIISLDKPMHFLDAEGTDMVVSPGIYRLAAVESKIWLIPSEGEEAPLLEAQAVSHEESVTAPRALTISEGEDDHHLVLLLPEGKGLDAAGTSSGMRSRATRTSPMLTIQTATTISPQVIVNPSTTLGGTTVMGMVKLGAAVPAGRTLQVSLSSSMVAAAQTPVGLTIPSGQNLATFSIITKPVQGTTSVMITASAGGVSRSARLVLTSPPMPGTPPPTTQTSGSNPYVKSVRGENVVGNAGPSTGTLQLSAKTNSRTQVYLASTNPSLVKVPASVWVEAGQDNATFSMTGSLPVATQISVTVSASDLLINALSGFLGQVKSSTVWVVPPTIKNVLCPAVTVQAGQSIKCVVILNGPVASGAWIYGNLASSAPTLAKVPGNFSVGGLQSSMDFFVSTNLQSMQSSTPISVSISATQADVTKSAIVIVRP